MAGDHCEAHSGVCVKVDAIGGQVVDLYNKLNDHTNGNNRHVYRPEHERIEQGRSEEIRAMKDSIGEHGKRLDGIETERKVEKAELGRGDKLLLAVLAVVGPLVSAALTKWIAG